MIGCSPSCDSNAMCQEGGEVPMCVCNPGYQGDGYNCTGLSKKHLTLFNTSIVRQSVLPSGHTEK